MVAVAVVAALATLALSGPGLRRQGEDDRPRASRPKAKAGQAVARGDIVVLLPRRRRREAVKTLADAIGDGLEPRRRRGDPGRRDHRPPRQRASRSGSPDGGLTLRAADGARPVLEVKVKGSQPMFLVNANLRLARA